MRTDWLNLRWVLLALGCVAAPFALAGDDTTTRAVPVDTKPESGQSDLILPPGEVAAASERTCEAFGGWEDRWPGHNRYRANVYGLEYLAELVEIQIELRFNGNVDLYFTVHRALSGTHNPVYDCVICGDDLVVTCTGDGTRQFCSTDPCPYPCPLPLQLEPGYDYVIGVSWTQTDDSGSPDVTYALDYQTEETPFLHGKVRGSVSRNTAPPVADSLENLFLWGDEVYSMQLCYVPVEGACCDSGYLPGSGCREVLWPQCTAAGSFFFGERTTCSEIPCDFGACCFTCGECEEDYTAEACVANGGVNHWSGADCTDPDVLCPATTRACCIGGECQELCRDDCDLSGGEYREDDTTCDPNVCVGVCCVPGACLELTPGFCSWVGGAYRGDGTECLTLPPEDECGGACCWSVGQLEGCFDASSRTECTFVGGVSDPIYRGAGTQCLGGGGCPELGECSEDPDRPCNTAEDCVGYCNVSTWVECTSDQECIDAGAGTVCVDFAGNACDLFVFGSCCLPDGTCLYTTSDACAAEVPGGGEFAPDTDNDGPAVCETRSCGTDACCFSDATCQVLTPWACSALEGTSMTGHPMCELDLCIGYLPTGACCDTAWGVCTDDVAEADCVVGGGVYVGDNTVCAVSPEVTCPGFSACCWSNGACEEKKTRDWCEERDGDYLGDGITCVDCEDQRGACCTDTGLCLFILEEACDAMTTGPDEYFQGIGVECDPCIKGACCLPDGGCEVRRSDRCTPDVEPGVIYGGDDEECDPGACTRGVCCKPNETCENTVASMCTAIDDEFHPSLACEAGTCFVGACCNFGGCTDETLAACNAAEGIYQGAGIECLAGLCTLGSCCELDDTCTDNVVQSQCDETGGRFRPGIFCDSPISCDQRGACCHRNGICEEDILPADCAAVDDRHTPDTMCDTLDPPCEAIAACCISGVCTEVTETACADADGVFVADEPDCTTPGLCTPGICCHLNGTCDADVLASECTDPTAWFRVNGDCDRDCFPRGACCRGNECVEEQTREQCEILPDDVYVGDGTVCLPYQCELVACCLPDEDCFTEWRRHNCESEEVDGVYLGPPELCDDADCTRGACCRPDGTCTGENTVPSMCEDPEDFEPGATCNDCVGRGACCLPDDDNCYIKTQEECQSLNGQYGDDATTCELPDLCHVGACCMFDDTCDAAQTRLGCELFGGIYLGAGLDCTDLDCTRGACCKMDGTCFDDTLVSLCASAGADFEPGATCETLDPPCEPRGACCIGRECLVMTESACANAGGSYRGNNTPCDPNPCELVIVSSEPSNCTIDARQPSNPDGTNPDGWTSIDITFDGDASGLIDTDFAIEVPVGSVAVVPTVSHPSANTVTVEFGGIIPTGTWSCVIYNIDGTMICLGYLPADVTSDRTSAPSDILRVIDCINGDATCKIHQGDVDRSGVIGPPDILRLIDLLNGAGVFDPWLNVSIDPCPSEP